MFVYISSLAAFVQSSWRQTLWPAKPKILLSGSLPQKLANPLLWTTPPIWAFLHFGLIDQMVLYAGLLQTPPTACLSFPHCAPKLEVFSNATRPQLLEQQPFLCTASHLNSPHPLLTGSIANGIKGWVSSTYRQ